ncbi:non-motile and phage-resistance protein [bacterium MnTg02]|nr:non-motile and phage-resistance protein [bacterium MnTg02]
MARIWSVGQAMEACLAAPLRDDSGARASGNRLTSNEALQIGLIGLIGLAFILLFVRYNIQQRASARLAEQVFGQELDLTAEAIAAKIKLSFASLSPSAREKYSNWPGVLEASLPKLPAQIGRIVLLADRNGTLRAVTTEDRFRTGDNLFQIIQPQQLVSILSRRNGLRSVSLLDGRKFYLAVRILPNQGMVALFQSPSHLTVNLGYRSSVEFGFLAGMALILLLVAGGIYTLAARVRTERRRANARLSDTETALLHSRCGLWSWSLDDDKIRWSRSMYALLGLSASHETLTHKIISRLLHPKDRLRAHLLTQFHEGGTTIQKTFRMRHQDGHWMWLEMRGKITISKSDGTPRLTALITDITELKQAQSQNQTIFARLLDAIDTVSEAFVLWDSDRRLVLCNRKFQEFHKLPDDAVKPGTSYDDLVEAANYPVFENSLLNRRRSRAEACTYEAKIAKGRWLHINERRTTDGGFVSIGTNITAVKRSEQRLSEREKELKATVQDLRSSRRQLERQAQQLVELADKYMTEKTRAESANRTKSEFLANISHELRTPLNAVIGFSEIMKRALFGPIGNKKYAEYCRDIHASGKYLLEVINDILDMSKIEAGRVNLSLERVELDDIIEDSLRMVLPAAQDRQIVIERQGLTNTAMQADKRALKQILINLISNAIRFTPEKGQVTVRLTKSHGLIRLSITDTGVGIPKRDLAKLGRPFEQVENQFTKSHKGSGLGLAISRSLVELHGGDLLIRSKIGEGTTVTCRFPVDSNCQQPKTPTYRETAHQENAVHHAA